MYTCVLYIVGKEQTIISLCFLLYYSVCPEPCNSTGLTTYLSINFKLHKETCTVTLKKMYMYMYRIDHMPFNKL